MAPQTGLNLTLTSPRVVRRPSTPSTPSARPSTPSARLPSTASEYLVNDIERTTSRTKLIDFLLAGDGQNRAHEKLQYDMISSLEISNSRLDDDLSVAIVKFRETPKWLHYLNDEPFGFPKKTSFGTLWKGVDLTAVDEHGQTEFIRAARQDFHYAESLAEFPAVGINVQDKRGRTALHWACVENLPMVVMLCLSIPECDIGLTDANNQTAFDISLGDASEVIPTLFYRSMFEMEDTHPQDALLRALTVTAEPVEDRIVFPGNAIFDPIQQHNAPLVKALVNRKVDLTAIHVPPKSANESDDGIRGYTALQMAAEVGDAEIVRALLTGGAAVEGLGTWGYSALQMAVKGGHEEVVEMLLAGGANPEGMVTWGYTALQMAVQGRHKGIATALLIGGAQSEATGTWGNTALQMAVDSGDTGMVRALLAGGAQTGVMGSWGYSALQMAVKKGNTEMVEAFVTGGAETEALGTWGATALQIAVKEGNTEIVKIFMAAKAPTETMGSEGYTPLQMAVNDGNTDMVKELLAGGAQTQATGTWGDTSLEIAQRNGFEKIEKLLKEYGARTRW